MTTFDEAWAVAKAPLYEDESDLIDAGMIDTEDDRYTLLMEDWLKDLGTLRPRWWQSRHGDARGYAPAAGDELLFQETNDDSAAPHHQIISFEMARESKGRGLMRDRLQEMIAELRERDPEARSTHVTHVETDTADLWDKLVDEGLIDSASTKPYVTTTPEGRLLPYTTNREST